MTEALPTLRNRLLRHILVPLALMWLLASVLMVTVGAAVALVSTA